MIGRTGTWKLRGGIGGSLAGALAALAFAALAPAESVPPVTPTDDAARAALLQSDGRIVALGDSDGDLALARYRPGGSLDPTFGDGGKLVTSLPAGATGEIDAAALAPDGKIVAAGRSGASLLVARYERDGSLDTTFGDGGIAVEPCCPASAVAVAADGGIVVAGPSRGVFQLRRLTPVGGLDRSFGSNGRATVDLGAPATARALALQPDGKIVAVGTEGESLALARFDAEGSPDPTFGANGDVTSTALQSAAGVAVDGAGRIIVGGATSSGTAAVARFDSEGTIDPAFGAAGAVTVPGAPAGTDVVALALETSGDIAAGDDSLLEMLSPTGLPDPGFTAPTTVPPTAALLPTADGGVVSVGTANGDFALTRLLLDGSVDEAFGNAGSVTTDFARRAPTAVPPPTHRGGPSATPAGHHHRKPQHHSPHPVPAWYINADNMTELKRFAAADACSFAHSQPKRAHRTLLLDFGGARAYGHGSYGAAVNNNSFKATNRQIRLALKVAADAYAACHKRGQGKIVYGVTNHFKFKNTAIRAHEIGVRQGSTVNHVWNYVQRRGYYPTERTGVAGDIETGYWGPKYSKAMANGAKATWGRGYIDFGTAGGCPPNPSVPGRKCYLGWTLADVAHVSNSGGGDPLPEIYYYGGQYHPDQAAEWAHVARAWNHQHAGGYVFAGTTGSTEFSGMTPGQSWRRMKHKAPGHVGRELINFKQDHWVTKSGVDAAP